MFAEIQKLTEIDDQKRFFGLKRQIQSILHKECQKLSKLIFIFFYFAKMRKLAEIRPENQYIVKGKKIKAILTKTYETKSSEIIQSMFCIYIIFQISEN